VLISILISNAGGGSGFNIDFSAFGAFGITLAFGAWVLRDVMRERDKARDLADRQAKSIDSIERVLVSIQGTLEKFEGGIDDLAELLRALPRQVEVDRLNKTLESVERVIEDKKSNG
jgi:hypothetical protein